MKNSNLIFSERSVDGKTKILQLVKTGENSSLELRYELD